MVWPVRSSRRVRDGLLAIIGVAALCFAAYFALHQPREHSVRLRMTAGQEEGTRHRIAQALRREAVCARAGDRVARAARLGGGPPGCGDRAA